MLELLQARGRVGGRELAERLGVEERTVRRYAVHLTDLGIPVVAERGRYGGYRLLPGYKLPPLMLSDDEATVVVLSLLAGRRMGLPDAAAESALGKIQRVLPDTVRAQVEALRVTLAFTFPEREGAAPATPVALTLATAAREGRRVGIRYRSWDGRESERDLDAYGLVLHSGRWYVSGLDHQSGEIRTFRVDRIAAVEPRSVTFEQPEGFDPAGHVTRSLAAVPYAHEVEVVAGSLEELTEGGVLLRARAEHLDGMARMLAGLGWPFTVHRPAELADAVREWSACLASYAQRKP
jgi:predicted DNA-binding transcriptional regulator YafY